MGACGGSIDHLPDFLHHDHLCRQIPGFVLYHGGKLLLKYVFTPDASEQEDDDAAIKKREKAERKAARPKFRRG